MRSVSIPILKTYILRTFQPNIQVILSQMIQAMLDKSGPLAWMDHLQVHHMLE